MKSSYEVFDDRQYVRPNAFFVRTKKAFEQMHEKEKGSGDIFARIKYRTLLRLLRSVEPIVGNTHTRTFQGITSQQERELRYMRNVYGYMVEFPSQFSDGPLYRDQTSIRHENITSQTDGEHPDSDVLGYGIDKSVFGATAKALGEAKERLLLITYRKKELLHASIQQMKKQRRTFVNPRHHERYSNEQKEHDPQKKYTENDTLRWELTQSLLTEKNTYIPAQYIYWTYHHERNEFFEPLLEEPNSNACAGGNTQEEAVSGAICEAIERDAFITHWLGKRIPSQVNPHSFYNEQLKKYIQTVKRNGFEIYLLDITTEFNIPVITCVLLDKSGVGPYLSVGAGCHFYPESAAESALNEAVGVYNWMRNLEDPPEISDEYEPFSDTSIDRKNRLQVWANPKMAHHATFLMSGEERSRDELFANYVVAPDTPRDEVSFLVKKLVEKGKEYEPFVYITDGEAEGFHNFFAVSVYIPGLAPLYLHEKNAPIGMSRILKECGNNKTALNPYPHPFP